MMIYDYDSSTLTEMIDICNNLYVDDVDKSCNKLDKTLLESMVIANTLMNKLDSTVITIIEAGEVKSDSVSSKIILIANKVISTIKNIANSIVRFFRSYATKVNASIGMYDKWITANMNTISSRLKTDKFTRSYTVSIYISKIISLIKAGFTIGMDKQRTQLAMSFLDSGTSISEIDDFIKDNSVRNAYPGLIRQLSFVNTNTGLDAESYCKSISDEISKTTEKVLKEKDIVAYIQLLLDSNHSIKASSNRVTKEGMELASSFNEVIDKIKKKAKESIDKKDEPELEKTKKLLKLQVVMTKISMDMNTIVRLFHYITTMALRESFKVLKSFITDIDD